MKFNENVALKDVAIYSVDKVHIDDINEDNYISTENLVPNYGGKTISSGLPNVKNVSEYKINDVLISNIRPYFKKIWRAKVKGGASNDVLVVRPKDNIVPEFLYYNLANDNFFDYVMSGAKGTKMPRGDKKHIMDFKINFPPIQEQKAIAHILSTLDEKIEVNNQINKTLENMAQAIFKQWFVDFEFPNEDGEPYKSSGGGMVESELGMIPKGWEVVELSDITEFQNGYAFYKIGYSEFGKKVVDLSNVNILGEFIETDRDKYISYEIYNDPKMEKFKLIKDDLVMIMTDRTQEMNILGKTGKIPYSNRYILNQRVGRIRTSDRCDVNFIRSALNSDTVLDKLKSVALGSVQKYINTNHIKEIRVVLPTQNLMTKYSDLVNPIYEYMHKNNEENVLLIKKRNTLLPKLMSGEIRVPLERDSQN